MTESERKGRLPRFCLHQPFWSMYGLELPGDELKTVYYENAVRFIPELQPSRFAWTARYGGNPHCLDKNR